MLSSAQLGKLGPCLSLARKIIHDLSELLASRSFKVQDVKMVGQRWAYCLLCAKSPRVVHTMASSSWGRDEKWKRCWNHRPRPTSLGRTPFKLSSLQVIQKHVSIETNGDLGSFPASQIHLLLPSIKDTAQVVLPSAVYDKELVLIFWPSPWIHKIGFKFRNRLQYHRYWGVCDQQFSGWNTMWCFCFILPQAWAIPFPYFLGVPAMSNQQNVGDTTNNIQQPIMKNHVEVFTASPCNHAAQSCDQRPHEAEDDLKKRVPQNPMVNHHIRYQNGHFRNIVHGLAHFQTLDTLMSFFSQLRSTPLTIFWCRAHLDGNRRSWSLGEASKNLVYI